MRLVEESVIVRHHAENGQFIKEWILPLAKGSTVEEFFNFHQLDERLYYVTVGGKRPWSNRVLGNNEIMSIQDIETISEEESSKYFDVLRLA